jgi:hypothetical protein
MGVELMTTTPTIAAHATRFTAAERMRRHRERRRNGMRCLTIELHETEIDTLIGKGVLRADARNDQYAICQALYGHLQRTL